MSVFGGLYKTPMFAFSYPQFTSVKFYEISFYMFIENAHIWSFFEGQMVFYVQCYTNPFSILSMHS